MNDINELSPLAVIVTLIFISIGIPIILLMCSDIIKLAKTRKLKMYINRSFCYTHDNGEQLNFTVTGLIDNDLVKIIDLQTGERNFFQTCSLKDSEELSRDYVAIIKLD